MVRAFAASKLGWIRQQQIKLQNRARQTPQPLEFVTHENHWVWGQRCVLTVQIENAKPSVQRDHEHMTLTVRPGSDTAKRAAVMHAWHQSLLHEVVPGLIQKWEPRLGVKVQAYFLQRMKTRWGSCHYRVGHIRLNTELVKKPPDLLEYVIVHELAHLLVPNHGKHFVAILDRHVPNWREAQAQLNALPLATPA
jgi:predicted metal-dependent hydrolase